MGTGTSAALRSQSPFSTSSTLPWSLTSKCGVPSDLGHGSETRPRRNWARAPKQSPERERGVTATVEEPAKSRGLQPARSLRHPRSRPSGQSSHNEDAQLGRAQNEHLEHLPRTAPAGPTLSDEPRVTWLPLRALIGPSLALRVLIGPSLARRVLIGPSLARRALIGPSLARRALIGPSLARRVRMHRTKTAGTGPGRYSLLPRCLVASLPCCLVA